MKKIFLSFLFLLIANCGWAQEVTVKEIKIGLLMSFQLQEQIVDDTSTVTEPSVISSVLPSLQFYEGALMAIKNNNGDSVKFHILDLGKDSIATTACLQQKITDTCDVYFAIVPSNCNAAFMKFIKRCKRPVISLNSIPQILMKVNPGLWLATPSNLTLLKQFSSFIYQRDSTSNLLLIHREDKKEEQLVNFVFNELDSLSGKTNRIGKYNFKTPTWDALKLKLKSKKENYIFVPTNDESFLTTVVEMLSTNKGSYNITLCGLPSWEGFESISPLDLTGLNTTIFNGYFIDYDLQAVKDFRLDYIEEYHADPITNSYLGFDLTQFVIQNREALKSIEETNIPSYVGVGGQSFVFERTIQGGCMENTFFNVLRYDTDHLTKLNK